MKKLLSIMLVLTMALTLARRLRRLRLVFGAGGKLRLHGWQLFGAR